MRRSDTTRSSLLGRSSHARSAPCAWWVYPTATTFRKARHHRSCYVRRAMWWMVVIQGVGESGEGWFGERVGWGWWMVGFEFKCNLCECGQLKDWPTAQVWLSDGALPSSHNKSTQVAQPWCINLRNYHHLGSTLDNVCNVYKAFFHMNPIISALFPNSQHCRCGAFDVLSAYVWHPCSLGSDWEGFACQQFWFPKTNNTETWDLTLLFLNVLLFQSFGRPFSGQMMVMWIWWRVLG